MDGEDLGLRVKMTLGGNLQRPSGDLEGIVLNPLELKSPEGGVMANRMGTA